MSSIAQQPMRRKVAIGVDTHKHIHVAVVLDELGGRLGELTVPADCGGYVQLERWAVGFGRILAFGIEGTGSYGAGVASHLQRQGHRVIEVNRPDRRERRMNGKSDVLDAENAARAVLSGRATAMPKAADGEIEMLRQIKIAKDTAVKARTQAMVTLKTLVVTAPPELREELDGLPKMALIERCAGLRPGPMITTLAATKHALRGLARRWQQLQVEIKEHERHLAALTERAAPAMVAAFGIGPDTAAEMLIVAGDNPERVRSEPAWAKLCGVCPVPASSGKTSWYRLNRGGHRQPTRRCTERSSSGCASTSRRSTTSPAGPPRARRRLRSSAASSATSPARSGPTCTPIVTRLRLRNWPLDDYRSFNAMIESFWSRMQVELLDRRHWRTRAELANAIFEYLEIFHNRQRRHSALGMLTPIEFETRHQPATVA